MSPARVVSTPTHSWSTQETEMVDPVSAVLAVALIRALLAPTNKKG